MATALADNMQDSATATSRHVWPALLPYLGGKVMPVEREATDMALALDMKAGIDYWHLSYGGMMVGVGTRVQWVDVEDGPRPVVPKNKRSFTVRMERANGSKSEYDRILQIGQHAGVKPHLMVHAYFKKPRTSGDLISAAVARSRDIAHLLQRKVEAYGRYEKAAGVRKNPEDGTWFGVVTWEEIEKARMPLVVVSPILGIMTDIQGARDRGVERLWSDEFEW